MTTATLPQEPSTPTSETGRPRNVIELVSHLSRRGVRLWADEDDRLRFKAPAGALTPELKSELGRRKGEVLEFLSQVRDAGDAGSEPAIEPVSRDGDLPLSFAQERLWLIDRLDPGSASYNIFDAIRLEGQVTAPRISQAMGEIFRRHEVLRTTFASRDGRPIQHIAPATRDAVPVVDLGGLFPDERETEARRLLDREVHRGFDLARGPLLRTWLIRLRAGESVLLFNMHHIVSDGWSTGVLVRELAAIYAASLDGTPSPLEPLPIQYADFAAWQRHRLGREQLDRQMAFWRETLRDVPDGLELPTDHARPAVRTSEGATYRFTLSPALAGGARVLAREAEVTPFVVLLTNFFALLHRYTHGDDLVVGTPTANRNRRQIEGLIGFFVNTLVLRGDLSGAPTFRELLGRTKMVSTAAQENQDVPFERLVEELAPERDLSKTPLFQVMFVFQNAPGAALEAPGLRLERLELFNTTTKLDLTLSITDETPVMTADVEYSTELFDETTVARMMRHFRRLLDAAVTDPDRPVADLELLLPEESHQVLWGWNDRPAVPGADASQTPTVVELIAEQARQRPDSVAVVFEDRALTYGALDARSTDLARRLVARGAGPEVPVGIFLERSTRMITAMLAVLKTGAPYVPLDPSYPEERLSYMLREPGSRVMISTADWAEKLAGEDVSTLLLDRPAPDDEPEPGELPREIPPEAAVYVIYTSGSTGRPKGVVNHHGALSRFVRGYSDVCRPGPEDRFFLILSFAFDASVGGVFPALAGGSTLVLHKAPSELSSLELTDFLEREGVTLMDIPVNFWNHWLEDPTVPRDRKLAPALRAAVSGGEPLYRDRLEDWGRRTARPVRFYGAYGPTETTVAATVEPTFGASAVPAGRSRLPIGRPIRGVRTYLLDPDLQTVPVGVTAEVYLAGTNVTRGYLHEPGATASRFVPDPWGEPGDRMYRTGDYARHLADGRMEFQTRHDDQVKIRGFRIEPAEVEAVLARHPDVSLCAVAPKQVGAAGRQLVAYVVRADGGEDGEGVEPADLRSFLKSKLPPYMVPSVFLFLDELPWNPASDKVDVQALPDPEPGTGDEATFVEPRTATEEVLVGLWGQLLGAPRIGVRDDFFALGGHSLLATQLISRIADTLGVELPLRVLFEGPTVEDLARHVDHELNVREAAGEGEQAIAALERVPRDQDLPASYAQERMWLFEQMAPGTPTYNTYRAGHTWGPLGFAALRDTYDGLIGRHEALRTRYATGDGEVLQVIEPPRREALPLVDLRRLTEDDRRAQAFELAMEDAREPVPLDRAPVSRPHLLRLEDEEHVFLWSIHHIAYDLWSGGILLEEVERLYLAALEGRPAGLPELPFQYADFAVWQRRWLSDDRIRRDLEYWRGKLSGLLDEPMELPTDRPRPVEETHRGHSIYPRVDRELTDALWGLARKEGVTQFMLLSAALKTVLHRYTGHPRPVVGTFISNRNRRELEGVVGYFDNTVVLRTDAGDAPSFRTFLERVRETSLGAYAHQHLPFETLAAALRPRGAGGQPLFQVDFVFELNYPAMERELAGLKVVPYNTHSGTAKFDLNVGFRDAPDGLRGEMELNTDLFDVTTIERLAVHFRTLLAGVVREPERPLSELPMLSPAEDHQLRFAWNEAGEPGPETTPTADRLHDLFEAQAARTPEATALRYRGEVWTYERLARRARGLAGRLQAAGVGPDRPVGIALERDPGMPAAMLAVLMAGGAYVPLDPSYPEDRLRFILEDTGAPVVLTTGAGRERLTAVVDGLGSPPTVLDPMDLDPTTESAESTVGPVASTATPQHLAYLIYTSGSTGRPKGVAVSHGSAVAMVRWAGRVFDAEELSGMLASTSINFDLSVFEIFVPLVHGGTVILADNALELPSLPDRERVRTVNTVPSAMTELVRAGALPETVRTVNLAGEPFTRTLAEAVDGLGTVERMFNLYGPSEDTTYSTWARVRADGTDPTIGRPVDGTRAWVVDRRLRPTPPGVPGELLLGGAGLARGYLNRPERTATSFVPDAFSGESGEPGARVYRTGDLVRYRGDGELEFLGRLDHQVKVRGFRIELGEIETALTELPEVRDAVVTVRKGRSATDARLVAYVVADTEDVEDDAVDVAAVRQALGRRLPDYMVPSAFVVLDSIPLTPTGKVDRRALDKTDLSASQLSSAEYVAPRSGLEGLVAEVWQEVLGVDRVGIHDNFFELGGHSLLLMSVHAALRRKVEDVDLQVVELFDQPTVAALAEYLERKRNMTSEEPAERPERKEELAAGKDRRRQMLERRRRAGRGGSS